MSRFDIRIHGREALEETVWELLTAHLDGTVFQSAHFLRVWLDTIGAARHAEPQIVEVRDAHGRAVLVLPLCIEHHAGASVLRFMDGGVSDANAPLLARLGGLDDAGFAALWPQILKALPHVDAVDFEKIPATINGHPNPMFALDGEDHGSTGNLIHIGTDGFDAYAADKRIKNAMNVQRRKINQCQAIAPVRFVTAQTPEEARHLSQRLFALKGQQFIDSYGHDLFAQGGLGAFYAEATSPGHLNRLASLKAIMVGDEVGAVALGFEGKDRFHFVLTTYDGERFGRYSLGIQLLIEMIREAANKGQSVFDLGEGNLAYKDVWVSERVALRRHRAALTLRGQLYVRLKQLKRLEALGNLRRIASRTVRAIHRGAA